MQKCYNLNSSLKQKKAPIKLKTKDVAFSNVYAAFDRKCFFEFKDKMP